MRLLIAALLLAGSVFAQDAKVVVLAPDIIKTKLITAVDGEFKVINHRNSFAELSVPAGEHTVCIASMTWKAKTGAMTLPLEAGKTYVIEVSQGDYYTGTIALKNLDGKSGEIAARQRKPNKQETITHPWIYSDACK